MSETQITNLENLIRKVSEEHGYWTTQGHWHIDDWKHFQFATHRNFPHQPFDGVMVDFAVPDGKLVAKVILTIGGVNTETEFLRGTELRVEVRKLFEPYPRYLHEMDLLLTVLNQISQGQI